MFQYLFYISVFLMGLAVGSFLNCLIYRLEIIHLRGRLFKSLGGRSFCPNCKHILSWSDLIPIFSFLILKGKCRYCQQKISWQYFLVEILTGLIFLLIFNFQFSILNQFSIFTLYPLLSTLYFLIIACFLIVIFVYDLKHYIIPDKVIYPAIAVAFFYQFFRILNFEFILEFGFWNLDFKALINPLVSALFASIFFFLIVFVSRGRWMGIGDIKLAFLMGLILGWPNILLALFSAFFIGAIIGIGLIIIGRKTFKSEIPFGPFLVTGTFIALFWGQQIINWYLHLLIF